MRYEMGFSEGRSTFYFHFFEMITYLTAFIMGQFSLYSLTPLLWLAPICYCGATSMIILARDASDFEFKKVMMFGALFGFGATHGLNLVGSHRLVEIELEHKAVRFVVPFTILAEAFANLFCPFTFYKLNNDVSPIFITVILYGIIAGLVFLQFLVAIIGSLKNAAELYHQPWIHIEIILYRLTLPLFAMLHSKKIQKKHDKQKAKEQKIKDRRWLFKLGMPMTYEETESEIHWLDRAYPQYPKNIVEDMKYKLNYWRIFLSFPGIFTMFEIKYSFWMFSVHRLYRRMWSIDFPASSIIALQNIFTLCFIIVFIYLLNPIFQLTFLRKPLRKMGLGALFILGSLCCSEFLVYKQDVLQIRPNEPYYDQTKVAIRNGLDCDVMFNERTILEHQQWSFAQISEASSKSEDPDMKSNEYRSVDFDYFDKINANDKLFDELKLKGDVDTVENVYPITLKATGDSATFFVKMTKPSDDSGKAQSVTVYPVNCDLTYPFNIPFEAPNLDLQYTSEMAIILIEPKKVSTYRVPFTRPREIQPGIRFFFANQTPVYSFEIMRDKQIIQTYPYLNDLEMDFIFFEGGDGRNLEFNVNNVSLSPNFTLEVGGLYDIVFVDTKGTIRSLKVYEAESPHSLNFAYGFLQYILLAIGEFLFAVLGIRFVFSQTPKRFQVHSLCDWYLMYALANALVIFVLKSGLFITFYFQNAAIVVIFIASMFWFFIAAFQYNYKFPPDMKIEKRYNSM